MRMNSHRPHPMFERGGIWVSRPGWILFSGIENRACAYQGPGGRLGHCSGEDGRVRIRLISPIADLPDVQSDILNVDPDVVETRTHTQSNSGIGIRVALKITEGANG